MNITDYLADFGDWAYDRHGNVLSWYIRPLFLLPLAWFAYRRSGWGIAGTLVALATSMFWFPAPAVPDPRVEEFLEFEKDWLTGDWDSGKILFTLLVPLAIGNAVLIYVVRRQRTRRRHDSGGPVSAPERVHEVSAG